jgi:DNA sulfur modification protein DndC
MSDTIQTLIDRGALFAVNHSGGKDSQAMLAMVRQRVPAAQIVVVHAELPEVEWDGVVEHIQATTGGLPILYTRARRTLLQMIEERGMFPSPQQRQCTSDLKRGPIERVIRQHLKAHPEFNGLVVNCMGMRAQESPSRSKLTTFKLNAKNSVAGREWYDWLPIHDLSAAQVFGIIADAGQEPHWAYKAGMTRLSCCFCIMASRADLTRAAELNPSLYARYVGLERRLGVSMLMPKAGESAYLEDVTGILATQEN